MNDNESPESLPNSSLLYKALASVVGSVATALVATPLDVAKTRMQASGGNNASSNASINGHARSLEVSSSFFRLNSIQRILNVNSIEGKFGHRCLTCGGALAFEHECFLQDKSQKLKPRAANSSPATTLRTLMKIRRTEGLRGLYSGLSPTLAMVVPQMVLYLTAYEEFKLHLKIAGANTLAAPMIAGGCARTLVVFAVAPLELIRTRMQGLSPSSNKYTFTSVFKTASRDGFSRLWVGVVPTLWRDVPFSMIYWAGYDRIRHYLSSSSNDLNFEYSTRSMMGHSFIAGMGAGSLATLLTHPFDVIKTRKQLNMNDKYLASKGVWPLAMKITRNEGLRALFTGFSARIAKIAPSCAIMISSYEGAKQLFAGNLS